MKLLADRVAQILQGKLKSAGVDAKVLRRPGTRDPNWHQEHFQLAITSLPVSSQAAIDAYDKEFEQTKQQFRTVAIDAIREADSSALLFVQLKWHKTNTTYAQVEGNQTLPELLVHGYGRFVDKDGESIGFVGSPLNGDGINVRKASSNPDRFAERPLDERAEAIASAIFANLPKFSESRASHPVSKERIQQLLVSSSPWDISTRTSNFWFPFSQVFQAREKISFAVDGGRLIARMDTLRETEHCKPTAQVHLADDGFSVRFCSNPGLLNSMHFRYIQVGTDTHRFVGSRFAFSALSDAVLLPSPASR